MIKGDDEVSIHAPVMDANSYKTKGGNRQCFNPRARDGREGCRPKSQTRYLRFNPRARDGRELKCRDIWARHRGFNPRARDGREASLPVTGRRKQVSIHAPVMDANRYGANA